MLLRSLTLGLILAPFFQAMAQTPSPTQPPAVKTSSAPGMIVPWWPEGNMPGHGCNEPETHTQGSAEGVLRITYVSQPTLEIFKAPGAAGPVPAAIICPGGGYGLLAYNLEGTEIAAWLNTLGITGIVLKYRVPNNRDGALQDVERAMRLVRRHAGEWGVQPDKLGVIGFSAGGHLVARLSSTFQQPAYPPIDEADQQGCRPDFALVVYAGYLDDHGKLAKDITIVPATPATLTVIVEDDLHHAVDGKTYAAALKAANIPSELLDYPTGGHGSGLRSKGDSKAWPKDAAAWLRKTGILISK